jgi:hypothetical protein
MTSLSGRVDSSVSKGVQPLIHFEFKITDQPKHCKAQICAPLDDIAKQYGLGRLIFMNKSSCFFYTATNDPYLRVMESKEFLLSNREELCGALIWLVARIRNTPLARFL